MVGVREDDKENFDGQKLRKEERKEIGNKKREGIQMLRIKRLVSVLWAIQKAGFIEVGGSGFGAEFMLRNVG